MNHCPGDRAAEVGESQNQVSVIGKACPNYLFGILAGEKMEAFLNHM